MLVRSLQQQIQSLQKSVEDKDEELFELSASMASVQAEADFKVKQILQQQQQSNSRSTASSSSSSRIVIPSPTSNLETIRDGSTTSSSTMSSVATPLAQHLLQDPALPCCPDEILPFLLTPNTSVPIQGLVWQLVEHCCRRASPDDTHQSSVQYWDWLEGVLTWSAAARDELRRALTPKNTSSSMEASITIIQNTRIRRTSHRTVLNLAGATRSLYEPLGETHQGSTQDPTHSTTTPPPQQRLYLLQLARQFQTELLSCTSVRHLNVLSLLIHDTSHNQAWQEALCGSSASPVVQLLQSLLSETPSVSSMTTLTRRRRTPLKSAGDSSKPHRRRLAVAGLQVLRDCGGWQCTPDDFSRYFLGLLLDLLEQELVSSKNDTPLSEELTLAMLQVLQQTLRHSPVPAVRWLRTQMTYASPPPPSTNSHTTRDYWACSGVGVVVQVLHQAAVLNYKRYICRECIGILHVVLQQIQQDRQRAEEAADQSTCVSFLSVVSEYEDFYKSACHVLVAEREEEDSNFAKLVQLQLEEIAMDEEEEAEVKNS